MANGGKPARMPFGTPVVAVQGDVSFAVQILVSEDDSFEGGRDDLERAFFKVRVTASTEQGIRLGYRSRVTEVVTLVDAEVWLDATDLTYNLSDESFPDVCIWTDPVSGWQDASLAGLEQLACLSGFHVPGAPRRFNEFVKDLVRRTVRENNLPLLFDTIRRNRNTGSLHSAPE